jgi:Ca-activated chloride channel family protein
MEKISKDDPRFTAKALDEHSKELDALDVTAEDAQEFEETLALAKELEGEFGKAEIEDTLSEDQLSDLEERFEERESKWKLLMFPGWVYNVAACVAIGAVGIVMYNDTGLFEQEPGRPNPIDTAVAEVDQVTANEDVPESAAIEYHIEEAKQDRDNGALRKSENQVFTKEFAIDLSATEVDELLQYAQRSADAIVPLGNFAGPPPVQIPEAEGTVFSEVRVESSKMRLDNTRNFEDSRPAQAGESLPRIVSSAFDASEEAFELSPFTVDAGGDSGYTATSTLSGSRIGSGQLESSSQTLVLNAPLKSVSGNFERKRGFADTSRIRAQQLPTRIPASTANREGYDHIEENNFRSVLDNPLSTFSIDVDTASYSNMRRMIEGGTRPLPDAIRIEELVNYFKYDYSEPTGDTPFSVNIESASAPWESEHHLVRIGLKGKTIAQDERPAANLVFLVDVSGSMGQSNKLPLAQEALKLLVEQMGGNDRIAIVVYAGSSGLALPSTTANNQETIRHAIDNLRSGGSTNGGAGIELAYKVATEKFIDDGINRVVLCTDGDFNVGVTADGSLVRLIEEKAKSGVFFSAIGFGGGNYQDGKMEQLSNKGNGNYAYIDGKQEARKVFVDDMLGTLHTIAKDVKIQVDFNPSEVSAYRLIGYVNRKLVKEDFNDDKKDAGEIGAGHTVTALYEVVPAGVEFDTKDVDASKYQRPVAKATGSEEWLTVKLRYKAPDEEVSQLVDFPYTGDVEREFKSASPDFRFASSVAGFGMLLRDSAHNGNLNMDDVIESARAARSNDPNGLRSEFVELVRKAKALIPEVSNTN